MTKTADLTLYIIAGSDNIEHWEDFYEKAQDIDLNKVKKFKFNTLKDRDIAVNLINLIDGDFLIIDQDEYNLLKK